MSSSYQINQSSAPSSRPTPSVRMHRFLVVFFCPWPFDHFDLKNPKRAELAAKASFMVAMAPRSQPEQNDDKNGTNLKTRFFIYFVLCLQNVISFHDVHKIGRRSLWAQNMSDQVSSTLFVPCLFKLLMHDLVKPGFSILVYPGFWNRNMILTYTNMKTGPWKNPWHLSAGEFTGKFYMEKTFFCKMLLRCVQIVKSSAGRANNSRVVLVIDLCGGSLISSNGCCTETWRQEWAIAEICNSD